MNPLRLRARGGYLSNFILKWLTQKPDLGNCDWFAIAIHNPRSRSKVCKHLKVHEVSKFGHRRNFFTTRVNCIVQGFHSGLSNLLFLFSGFQIIPNNSSINEEGGHFNLLASAS